MQRARVALNSQTCLTLCLSIISWKISPPVFPINLHEMVSLDFVWRVRTQSSGEGTYDSSISGARFDRGCGVGAAWKEGLGFERTSLWSQLTC